jgi:hypothetical protein
MAKGGEDERGGETESESETELNTEDANLFSITSE